MQSLCHWCFDLAYSWSIGYCISGLSSKWSTGYRNTLVGSQIQIVIISRNCFWYYYIYRMQQESAHCAKEKLLKPSRERILWEFVRLWCAIWLMEQEHHRAMGTSRAVRAHTVLPVTRHKWTRLALTPAVQAGTRLTYPGGMEGWVDLGPWRRTCSVLVA